jgi:hypothetical protein
MQNTIAQNNDTANNAIANAMKAAGALKGSKDVVANAPSMTSVVFRKDRINNFYTFLPETQDRKGGTVQMWDGKKGSKPFPVDTLFYKTTVPVEDEAVPGLVERFTKEFGVKQVVLRKRLFKESIQRDDEGKVEKVDIEDYKARLKVALIKAIDEM